jgi:hypothetical protein
MGLDEGRLVKMASQFGKGLGDRCGAGVRPASRRVDQRVIDVEQGGTRHGR